MINRNSLLKGLNPNQRAVVKYDGIRPLLVEAGAGSGKTKVLTTKIAYLIQRKHVAESSILALTFTHNAAKEDKKRVSYLLNKKNNDTHISTIHSVCLDILHHTNANKTSVVISNDAQKNAIQDAINYVLHLKKHENIIKTFKHKISLAEDTLRYPKLHNYKNTQQKVFNQIYYRYLQNLKTHHLLDFGCIILFAIQALKHNQFLLKHYNNKFKYIFVDEYQDTNYAQATLIKLLSKKGHLMVVGDANQSIYGFQGADINNILHFSDSYALGAKIIKMGQNYRSTQNILNCANAIILNNAHRAHLRSYTANQQGIPVNYIHTKNDRAEGKFIAHQISSRHYYNSRTNHSQCTILCRKNSQVILMHKLLSRNKIPNYIANISNNILDHACSQDLLAYIYSIQNPNNVYSLERIINRPTRGIGTTSQNKWINLAEDMHKSLLNIHVIHNLTNKTSINKRTVRAIKKFAEIINQLQKFSKHHTITQLLQQIIKVTQFKKYRNKTIDKYQRKYLTHLTSSFDLTKYHGLLAFLNTLSLSTSKSKIKGKGVPIMTIHSAKGLEFPVVFIAGLNEGLFPSQESQNSVKSIEEERRVMYVAITRAEKKLYLTNAGWIHLYGLTNLNHYNPSQFIKEIINNAQPKSLQIIHPLQELRKRASLNLFQRLSNKL